MSSTYSPNLAIELIGTGDQAGNWGSTTNTNLGTLLEQAISGYVSYACDGTTQTLTMTNGADATARNMYLQLTTTGGGTLVVPANKKLYFIYNATSLPITVKVSGQTGVSVPAAAKVSLVCNGTDVVDATNYSSSLKVGGSASIGGTLTAGSITTYPTTTFTGAISGTALTVSAVSGTLYIGQYITSGAAANTQITAGSGSSWTVTPSQTVASTSMVAAAGATTTTVASTDNSTNIATTAFAKTAGAPTGAIFMWGTSSAPTGHLLCNGSAVSRTTYSTLYSVLSTTFGVGDGSTTFNLPNFNGSMPIGATGSTSSSFVGTISGTTLTVASGSGIAINQVLSGTSGTSITTANIVAGTKYQIVSTTGTTTAQWVALGAADTPTAGQTFVATTAGSVGTGTVYPVIASGTTITGFVSGTFGAAGVYTVSISQTINSLTIAGAQSALALGSTGGAATTGLTAASLPNHVHTANVTDPTHSHSLSPAITGVTSSGGGSYFGGGTQGLSGTAVVANSTGITVANSNTGSNTAISTISPYLGIYFIIKT